MLEVAGDEYVRADSALQCGEADILDIKEDNPRATFVADIADAPGVPDAMFDCVLVTQLLPFVYDVRAPLRTAYRILVPGGVLLVTTPGICRIAPVRPRSSGIGGA